MRRGCRMVALVTALSLLLLLGAFASADGPDWDLTPLPESFFDDAVFMGDSISVVLGQYCMNNGGLGEAQFLCEYSYGIHNAITGVVKIWYRGLEYFPDEVMLEIGAKKLFVMLGVNDIDPYGIDSTMEYWQLFTDRVKAANPDAQIFIQSMLPIWYQIQYKGLNDDNIRLYDERLRAFCEETGYVYVDLADYFRDGTGGLAADFCSDYYVHVTYDAAELWVEQLKNPANYSADPRLYAAAEDKRGDT